MRGLRSCLIAILVSACGGSAPSSTSPPPSSVGPPDAVRGDPSLRQVRPLSTSTVSSTRPTFRWASTRHASVDVCADRACARVEQSFDGDGSAQPTTALTRGVHFWRVRSGDATSATWEVFVRARSASIDTAWSATLDANGDGLADVLAIAPYDDDPAALFAGSASGAQLMPARMPIPPSSSYGNTASGRSAGDVNGDGYGDVILGRGEAHVYLGGADGIGTAPIVLTGADDTAFGASVAGLGDVDGDGYGDVMVLADHAHQAFLFRGSEHGPLTPGSAVEAPTGTGTGWLAPAGDVDGDGHADVMMSANGASEVWVYRGSEAGLVATPIRVGVSSISIAGDLAGDVDGDGLTDLVVAAGSGCGVLVRGASDGAMSAGGALMTGGHQVSCSWGISGAGDVNGDGFDDIAVGASAGYAAFLFAGGEHERTPLPSVVGDELSLEPMYLARGVGDVNGDGFADVIAQRTNERSLRQLLFLGSSSGSARHGTTLEPPASPAPPPSTIEAPPSSSIDAGLPREATACTRASDCATVRICHDFAAYNDAWRRAQPPSTAIDFCNGMDDWEWPGPPVVCHAGACELTYPPIETDCSSDTDCNPIPRMLDDVAAGACRLDCDAYVFGSRAWSYHAQRVPTGACPASCGEHPPLARCASGHCAPEIDRTFRARFARNFPPPFVDGAISVDDVQNVIERSAVASCEGHAVARAFYAQTVELRVSAGADGSVSEVTHAPSTLESAAVLPCLEQLARTWRFTPTSDHQPATIVVRFYVDTVP